MIQIKFQKEKQVSKFDPVRNYQLKSEDKL